MSIKHSKVSCDYCCQTLNDGLDIACRECYEKLEIENADMKKEIERLRNIFADTVRIPRKDIETDSDRAYMKYMSGE